MPPRLILLFTLLLFPVALYAQGQYPIHFSGSIVALPQHAAQRCIRDAIKYKKSQVCYDKKEQATRITSRVQDIRSPETGQLRREIALTYD